MSGSVKVSAEWFERDDVERLGAEAVMLQLSALAYSARQLTNGHVPKGQLRRLWPVEDTGAAIKALVDGNFWTFTDDGEGYQITDWHDFILDADEVGNIREQTRVRVERHRRHSAGDHSLCDRCSVVRSSRNAVTNAVTNGVSNGVSNGVGNTPSEPNRTEPNRTEPNRPLGREGGSEVAATGGTDSASAPSDHRPRLQVGDDNPLPNPTPWDVRIWINVLAPEQNHNEITVEPVLHSDHPAITNWSSTDHKAGLTHYRAAAHRVGADLAEPITELHRRHHCAGKGSASGVPDECDLSTDYIDPVEPFLSVNVPHELDQAWVDRIAAMFRDQFEETPA